jgi:hypothetical protein
MNNIDDYKIGINSELLQLASFEENRALATFMVQQATRTLDIASRLLDPPIFNSPEFIEAVRSFVTKNSKAKVRIIVHDPATIVKLGHRLVNLASHLSSLIEIRKAGNEHKYYSECLLVADDTAFLHRLNGERFEATANFNDRRQSKYYLDGFNSMWDASVSDPNLRRMIL